MSIETISAPIPLQEDMNVSTFDCGEPSLNEWLKKRAFKNKRSGASRTYVICQNQAVVGYYCLSACIIALDEMPKTLRRNMPEKIPVLVLGRLAIHKEYDNNGFGSALLRDAVLRALQASEIIGVVALLVHALSENARRFYVSRGFIPSPVSSMTLCLILKEVRKILKE